MLQVKASLQIFPCPCLPPECIRLCFQYALYLACMHNSDRLQKWDDKWKIDGLRCPNTWGYMIINYLWYVIHHVINVLSMSTFTLQCVSSMCCCTVHLNTCCTTIRFVFGIFYMTMPVLLCQWMYFASTMIFLPIGKLFSGMQYVLGTQPSLIVLISGMYYVTFTHNTSNICGEVS